MTDKIPEETFDKNFKWKSGVFSFILFIIFLIIFGQNYSFNEKAPVLHISKMLKCHSDKKPSIKQILMQEYFRLKGSPVPQKMAEAVLATNRPRLMASIAVRESRGNPKAVGDGGKSKGAFQVQAKHWGHLLYEKRVSKDAMRQALDSERILEALIAENNGNLHKALNAYGGDRTRKTYAKNILNELANIP